MYSNIWKDLFMSNLTFLILYVGLFWTDKQLFKSKKGLRLKVKKGFILWILMLQFQNQFSKPLRVLLALTEGVPGQLHLWRSFYYPGQLLTGTISGFVQGKQISLKDLKKTTMVPAGTENLNSRTFNTKVTIPTCWWRRKSDRFVTLWKNFHAEDLFLSVVKILI